MRYAIFSDIHANLEALEAVLAKIDELAQEEPIDQIWFLGDLVGYGPDPNACILKLRERTDVIIAGNHDWAAVGKIDLEDFSAAARISAEWTAEQLTEEHRDFLANLPESLELGECTLVHGSPYGPLWEYLTSDVLAERSFQYFTSRYCFVGHTHVPVIFQQPDAISNAPTLPLEGNQEDATRLHLSQANGTENYIDEDDSETAEMVAVHPSGQQSTHSASIAGSAMSAYKNPESGQPATEDEANAILEDQMQAPGELLMVEAPGEVEEHTTLEEITPSEQDNASTRKNTSVEARHMVSPEGTTSMEESASPPVDISSTEEKPAITDLADSPAQGEHIPVLEETTSVEGDLTASDNAPVTETHTTQEHIASPGAEQTSGNDYMKDIAEAEQPGEIEYEHVSDDAEARLNSEIEELLALLGLSQSMIQVTNEMITPPEGHWEAAEGYRAIINPGGVGQPRDGDPRAAFMIYDTRRGFEFYRIPYAFEKTQEKIITAGLPHYLAVRLEYGR
jgi:diadenosine tetraphosphatase ApaH/serine/threonine PP2A family protein phosphatase